MKSVSDKVV